jgi:hypothetical protein
MKWESSTLGMAMTGSKRLSNEFYVESAPARERR